jgi:pre-mRNA-splicing factor CWC22
VEAEDQITHQVSLEESDGYNAQINLDIFKVDPDYQENEKKYEVGGPL